MPFNSPAHRDSLHGLANYVAAATFLSKVGWKQDGYAHMVKEKITNEDTVLILVGKVLDDRLFCGPSGNWSPNNTFGGLRTAKYNFTLGLPDEDAFTNDFTSAFKTLGTLQNNIASMPHRLHFLLGEGEQFNTLRFATPVFEKREVPVQFPAPTFKNLPGFPESVKQSEVTTTPPPDAIATTPSDTTIVSGGDPGRDDENLIMDDTTVNWPISEDMSDEFRKIATIHQVQPLAVYKNDQYVDPVRVNGAMKNALVEVHFCLRHYRIQEKGTGRAVDSFSAIVQQIVILKEGVPKPMNTYKRKNVLDGPYKPKPFKSTSDSLAQSSKSSIAANTNAVASSSTTTPSLKNGQTVIDFAVQQKDRHNSLPADDETADGLAARDDPHSSLPADNGTGDGAAANATTVSTEQSDIKGKGRAQTVRSKQKKTV